MTVKIGVVGASGRTGQCIVQAVVDDSESELGAALVSHKSPVVGSLVGTTSVSYQGDLEALEGCDAVIDFSTPDVSVAVAERCSEHSIPLLLGTTGHALQEREKVREAVRGIPFVWASNTSIGAAVLGMLAEYAQSLLGGDFDVEVMEIHHRRKKDAPSGTAKTLAEGLAPHDLHVYARSEVRRPSEVGISSLRGGDVVGDHTVYFLGDVERIELTHRAADRRVFAVGAVRLVKLLVAKPPGEYSVRQLLTS